MTTPLEQIKEKLEKMRTDYIEGCMSGRIDDMVPYDKAIEDVQKILPSIIQEVEDALQKDMKSRMREWHGTGPAMVDDNYFSRLKEESK